MKNYLTWCAAFMLFFNLSTTCRAETFAFIPNQGNGVDSVTRIDPAGPTATDYILAGDPGPGPYGAAVYSNATGVTALVTLTDDDQLAKIHNTSIDGDTPPTKLSLPANSEPRGVAIGSDKTYAYVANFRNGTVSKIEVGGNMRIIGDPIAVGDEPWGVAVHYDPSEDVRTIYVANHADDSVSVITDDGDAPSTDTISNVGDGPIGLALTPDGRMLYVAIHAGGGIGSLVAIRTSDFSVAARVAVGLGPWGVAVGGDGAHVYVTNSLDAPSGRVTVIRTRDHAIEGWYTVGRRPLGVAAPLNGDYAYVVNQASRTISRVNVGNRDVIQDIGVILNDTPFAFGAFFGGSVPRAPSGLQATKKDSDQVSLTWTNNDSSALGVKIERRQGEDAAFEQVAKTGAKVAAFTDTDLADEATYYYRIRAYSEAADSSPSTMASVSMDSDSDSDEKFSWCFIGVLQAE